jgi:hypothetical protein
MIGVLILAVIGACLYLLLAYLMKGLLWPAIIATLIVGAGQTAFVWLMFGATFLWAAFRLRLILPFMYAAVGAAIAALVTAWVRRRRARLGVSADALEQSEQARKKRLRIVLLACSAIVLILVAGVVAFRIVLSNRVRRELNEMRAKGFPVTLEELNARYPQPPARQNAAEVYQKAFALYADEKGKYKNLWSIFSDDFKLPPNGEPLPQEMKRLMEAYVADNREALKLLHQAAAMPLCRFPVDFTRAFQPAKPRLGIQGWQGQEDSAYEMGLRIAAARLLPTEALVHADNGRAAEAAEAIVCALAVGRAMGDEPLVQTQGARAVFQMDAIFCLQRALSRTALSDEALRRIDDLLKDAVNLDGMTRAIAAARCMGSAAFTNRRAGSALAEMLDAYFIYTYAHLNDPAKFVAGIPVMKTVIMPPISWRLRFLGLLDMDHLCFLEYTKTLLEDWQERVNKGGLFREERNQPQSPFPYGPVQALLCGDFSWNFIVAWPLYDSNFTMLISEVELARTGIAVERYRNARGALPEKLSDLVPAWLPAVPLDPWDGKPLRYRKRDKGYVIYSVGSDRKDEGGSSDPEHDFKNITFRVAR